MDDNLIDNDRHNAGGPAAGATERANEGDRSAGLVAALPNYSRRLLFTASLLGALAGLISSGVGETGLLEEPAKREKFIAAGHHLDEPTGPTILAAARITLARHHAIFGGLFGFFLGTVGGLARRSIIAALVAGLAGGGVGAGIGAGAAFLALPIYARHLQLEGGDMLGSLILHACLWTGIGAAGGLALGLGLGGRLRVLQTAIAGALGALCGVLFFEVLGAIVFPLDETGSPISATARTRLLARLLVAVLAAAGAALVAIQSRPQAAALDLAPNRHDADRSPSD
jgi:hypothetical protein